MLKPFAAVAVLMLLAATAAAQNTRTSDALRGFHIGITGGVNFVDIRNPFDFPDPEIDHAYYVKPSIGVLGGYQFDDVFGFRTGVLYSRMGRLAEETLMREQPVEVEKTVDLDYLQFPLLLRLQVGTARLGAYAQAGLVYSLLQRAEVVRNGVEQETDGRYRDRETGMLFEVGPRYSFADNLYASLSFRGYLGISDLNHENLDTTGFLVGKSQNVAGGFHLTLGYQLMGGK